MKKRRILFLDHTAKMSGGERSLLLILEKLNRRRFTPLLVTFEDGPLLSSARSLGIACESVPIPRLISERKRGKTGMMFLMLSAVMLLPTTFALVRFVRRKDIDIIYTNSQKAHLIGIGVGIAAGIPVYWHFRDIISEGILAGLMRFTGILFANRIIAISEAVALQFMIYGRMPSKVRIIYNALDVKRFEQRSRSSPADLRREFNLPPDSRIVASVGQIASWKGQEYLLYAAKELLRAFGKLYFLIVGGALFKEQGYLAKLKDLVLEFGIDDRVFFAGFRDDIPGIMRDIDILVHSPIKPEPFGRVLIEAMVCNTPVVAFDIGAVREIVREGEGILVRPGDEKELVRGIRSLLEDRRLHNKIAGNALDAVKNRFDFPPLIEKIEHLLDV